MKIKTTHLFLAVILLFACSFYVVNLKFDKFYRVNGINNDNRVLIEKYLDKDEQEYLIDNQIPIESFIHYIKEDQFHLKNYQYYDYLKQSKRYSNDETILEIGNSLQMRLDFLFPNHAINKAKILIEQSLEMAFLNKDNFDFHSIPLYSQLSKLYDDNDYSYIDDTQIYVERLHALGYQEQEQIENIFVMMCQSFDKDALHSFLFTDHVHLVFNPYELSTIVDNKHYIGEYEPNDLILLQNVPRVRYSMYLQKDAYYALMDMYRDITQLYDQFLITGAYTGIQSLDEKDIGKDERQLGTTITVSQSQTKYSNFHQTELSHWLEENAYKYGYILRYPPDKASITNHKYDAHTYRYVGKNLAKSLHDSHKTLEEYVNGKK